MSWALRNLLEGLTHKALWLRFALTDIQQAYKRSIFGMAWIAFSFGLFLLVKIIIFGSISSIDGSFFAIWVTIGYWLWTFISMSVIDACNVFMVSRQWILGTSLPLSVYIYQTTTRGLMRFSFSLPVVIFILFIFSEPPTIQWLWVIPGLLTLIINCLWVQVFLGSICTKYRDLAHLTQSIIQVMFFLTPILYVPEQLGENAYLLNYNPFTHYLAIIREPLLSGEFPILSWQVVGTITVVGWISALLVFQKLGRNVPFRV